VQKVPERKHSGGLAAVISTNENGCPFIEIDPNGPELSEVGYFGE
jgi:hypothetical protein